MGYFQGVEKAKASISALYVKPGEYELAVREAKVKDSPRTGNKQFIVEYDVLAAAEGSGNKVGETPSHLIEMKGQYWLGEVKALVAAVFQIDPEKVDEKGVEAFISPVQPGRGKRVRASARNKRTQKGGDFTKVDYHNPALSK